MRAKTLCFYLPQFHPIPENDKWWGPGFTEWTNVARARPRFPGHHQPQIPANLGFYDLRLEETRIAQAELAERYGIDGFVYYHYWFGNERLLKRPLDDLLSSGKPNFPFCLCWANESWTRAWDGRESEVLIKQQYSASNHHAHIDWLLTVFRDNRYIKVDDRPLLLIYRPADIPDLHSMIGMWRSRARERGFPDLYLCAARTGFSKHTVDERNSLFDAIVDFQPNAQDFPDTQDLMSRLFTLAQRALPDRLYQYLKRKGTGTKRIPYDALVEKLSKRSWFATKTFPCVFPSWDNSARRSTPTVIQNDSPAVYGTWLASAVARVQSYPEAERFVFINAWNEWAEGCHLEPDIRNGVTFLDETGKILGATSDPNNEK